jgi:hypothetical protein
MGKYLPFEATLKSMSINGVNYFGIFHVKELRIYEDICKYYLTAQVVIEVLQNAWDGLKVAPLVPVQIVIKSGTQYLEREYDQFFRVYSYDSIPVGVQSGGADVRLEVTLNLVGQEFYNDRHNTVMKGYPNKKGTEIVKDIHDRFVTAPGSNSLEIRSSDGLMGSKTVPYQVNNVKPVKAIFDILDQIIYHSEPTASPVYYRDANHHVVAPLKYLIENVGAAQAFYHVPSQGQDMMATYEAYNNIIDLKPLTPPGQVSAESAAALDSLLNTTVFVDQETGNTKTKLANLSDIAGGLDPATRQRVLAMIAASKKGIYGGSVMFDVINDAQKARSIDKSASGHKAAQEAFITTLTYCQKYWISVPLNSGIFVTCGKNIQVTYPFVEGVGNVRHKTRKLFVPRLTHTLKFTSTDQQGDRKPIAALGTTDIYSVLWSNSS